MAQGPDEIGGERLVNVQTNEPSTRSSAPTTDELRTQIEATRTEMGDTIDAIQDRLRLGRLMADVKNVVKEATVGRVKSLAHKAIARAGDIGDWSTSPASPLQKMKDHPVPVALVGAATMGLVLGALRRRMAVDTAAKYVTHKRGATSNRSIRNAARFIAIAGAGLACWAIWKAQTFEPALPPGERYDSPGGEL
jgi:hypothetical protein